MDPLLRAMEGSNAWFAPTGLESMVLSLLLAFVLGQAMAWLYVWSHGGLSYSRSFTQSLVLMTLVTAIVMFVIGNSIITAFGLLGALALIRFRNVLKDTRDTVFVFIALVLGMAVGSQRFMAAIVGAVAIALLVVYLKTTAFGSFGHFDGYLTLSLVPAARSHLTAAISRYCRASREVSSQRSAAEEPTELVFQVGLRDRLRSDELVEELRRIDGVQHVSLVLRGELSEV